MTWQIGQSQYLLGDYQTALTTLQQALQEYPEQAKPYADVHALLAAPSPRQTVQMWARMGYAPPVDPAPRRGVAVRAGSRTIVPPV